MTPLAAYPAIVYFHDGIYEAQFIDLGNCYAQGPTLKALWTHSKKALKERLDGVESYPKASALLSINVPPGAFILVVAIEIDV